jgi:U3 small nucleolar RNA-associated protein 21
MFFRACIHTFAPTSILKSPSTSASITALSQSPAIDVLGIGFQTGDIIVYDIRADERMMRMFMEGGSIQALAFRTGMLYGQIVTDCVDFLARWTSHLGSRLINGAYCIVGSELWWSPCAHHPRRP